MFEKNLNLWQKEIILNMILANPSHHNKIWFPHQNKIWLHPTKIKSGEAQYPYLH